MALKLWMNIKERYGEKSKTLYEILIFCLDIFNL